MPSSPTPSMAQAMRSVLSVLAAVKCAAMVKTVRTAQMEWMEHCRKWYSLCQMKPMEIVG